MLVPLKEMQKHVCAYLDWFPEVLQTHEVAILQVDHWIFWTLVILHVLLIKLNRFDAGIVYNVTGDI